MKKRTRLALLPLLILLALGSALYNKWQNTPTYSESVMDVPAFSGDPYVVINDNEPEFSDADMTETGYEYYSDLDYLGRCGYAMACIGIEMMPTQERGSIGQVKPSGWHTVKYDFVDGKYLYNRCHLIGFQLTGENANECNLITGTRYLNVEGMLPFENMVADYIRETENHVLYRVTPVFDDDSLVARGVQMEAKSVEDDGEGICFNIYAYNNQPGVSIDYATGSSTLADIKTTEDAINS
jgi:DNA-entry nuclease